MRNRVVITGMGIVSPNGTGLDAFLRSLREGRSGIKFIPELAQLNFACQIGGIPQNIETIRDQYLGPKYVNYTNDNIAYATIAALDAWKDAGLNPSSEKPDWDTGSILGSGISDTQTIAEKIVPVVNSGEVRRMGARIVEQVMGSAASARIAGILGLGNQVSSNSSACSTGTEAIIEAVNKIRNGMAKRMVAGSSEASSPYSWGGFDAMRVLSRKFNDQPENGSRPMSASANGFVPGAGAGVVILEELKTAINRGARIYAEILGGFINCGGQRQGGTMTAPNHEGVKRCIRGAIKDAHIRPERIDAISGHLTGTFADPFEVDNWSQALEMAPKQFPFINATKSLIGHCLGAAGSIETVAAVLELYHGFLHPSVNCEDIHEKIKPFIPKVVGEYLDYPELSVIAKASFGFGDVNSCLIIKKWES